jgi:hypothetical protein
VAAAIQCGLLPADRIPTYEEFLAVPFYDRTPPGLIGRPYYMGLDKKGNKTYFMGMWSERRSLAVAIEELLDSLGVERGSYLMQDAFPLLNFSTKFGGLLSKRYHLTQLGRRITVWGIKRQYARFVQLVREVGARVETGTEFGKE